MINETQLYEFYKVTSIVDLESGKEKEHPRYAYLRKAYHTAFHFAYYANGENLNWSFFMPINEADEECFYEGEWHTSPKKEIIVTEKGFKLVTKNTIYEFELMDYNPIFEFRSKRSKTYN